MQTSGVSMNSELTLVSALLKWVMNGMTCDKVLQRKQLAWWKEEVLLNCLLEITENVLEEAANVDFWITSFIC